MKIFSKDLIQKWDEFSIVNQYKISLNLMESAAAVFASWFRTFYFDKTRKVIILAGFGNNGGDALAIARILHLDNYDVEVFLFRFGAALKPDCQANLQRCLDLKISVNVAENIDAETLDGEAVLIDGLFGSGLARPLQGDWANIIAALNSGSYEMVSIDIPSGIDADKGLIGPALIAAKTLTFEIPKFAFFLDECQKYIGEWDFKAIGLSANYYAMTSSNYFMLNKLMISSSLKGRNITADKTYFGFAQLCGGSRGMLGAIILATKSAMRSGLGRLVVTTPSIHHQSVFVSTPVAMVQEHQEQNETNLNSFVLANKQISALAFGPGMGVNEATLKFTKEILKTNLPLIIDADGLNIIAKYHLLESIPRNAILTPHKNEFSRLFGSFDSHYEMIQRQIEVSLKYQIYIVLKGAHTSVSTPSGLVFMNNTGNPGMATAGSGDVLTGLLLGLLAQGYTCLQACQIGVYIHGLSGDLASLSFGEMAMNAEDIITFLPQALKNIHET